MLLPLIIVIAFILLAFPETEIGRSLHRMFVQAPARLLSRVTPGKLLLAAAVSALGLTFFLLFEADGLRFFSMIAPELAVWFAMFDVSLFLDAVLVAAALIATTRLRAVRDQAVVVVQGAWARVSARRTGGGRSKRPRRASAVGAASDDPAPAWSGLALAVG